MSQVQSFLGNNADGEEVGGQRWPLRYVHTQGLEIIHLPHEKG